MMTERLENMRSIELVDLTRNININWNEIRNNQYSFGCKNMEEWIELVHVELIRRGIKHKH